MLDMLRFSTIRSVAEISGSGLGTTFILTLPRQIGPEKEKEPIFEELVVSHL